MSVPELIAVIKSARREIVVVKGPEKPRDMASIDLPSGSESDMTELLRETAHACGNGAEFDALEERRKVLAKRLPWTDDAFNEMLAINRQLVELATNKPVAEPGSAAA